MPFPSAAAALNTSTRAEEAAGANPARAACRQLEQLGADPRAAFPLVQVGESEDRRPPRFLAGPSKAIEQLPLERGQPRVVGRQPIAGAAHQAHGPLGDRAEVVPSGLGGRSAHEPAPSCLSISSTLETESSKTDQ